MIAKAKAKPKKQPAANSRGKKPLMRRYDTLDKRRVEVARALDGRYCAMYLNVKTGAHHRVKSPALPLCATAEAAQADLDRYAQRMHWAQADHPEAPVTPPKDLGKPKTAKDRTKTSNGTNLSPMPPIGPIAPSVQLPLLLPLDATERRTFAKLETIVRANLNGFVAAGQALAEINRRRLYRENFPDFRAYCRQTWDIDKSTAHRLIAAAEVVQNLTPKGTTFPKKLSMPLPRTESQARALARIETPEEQKEVWSQVLKVAPKGSDGAPRVTAELVEATVREYVTPPEDLEKPRAAKDRTQGSHETNLSPMPLIAPIAPEPPQPLLSAPERSPDPEPIVLPPEVAEATRTFAQSLDRLAERVSLIAITWETVRDRHRREQLAELLYRLARAIEQSGRFQPSEGPR